MTPEIGLGKCVYLLVGRCTVTLLPNFLGWCDLLTYGAPKRAWSSVKRTKGAGGPSGVDANGFRRILACKSFKQSSTRLWEACNSYNDEDSVYTIH